MLGSDGALVAQQVAEKLGYRFVDKQIFERILQEYGLIEFEDLYDSAPGFWARFDSTNLQIISMLNKTILAIARFGDVVILGRGGYAALRAYADVLHVRIQAPSPIRAQRLMETEGYGRIDEANSVVARNDKARAQFVRGFYDADFYTTSQFHLVLDSSIIAVDVAATWIAQASRSFATRSFAGALTTNAIDVDPILASTIEQVLESEQE
jgi:cytidylate kinase